jgi:hypothetical protein
MRLNIQVPNQSTEIFVAPRGGILVAIQAPLSNTLPVEIAIDDVDTPLAAGGGILVNPGDWREFKPEQNANGRAGILALSTGAQAQALILQA